MAPLPPATHVLRVRTTFAIAGKQQQGLRQYFRWSGTSPSPATCTTLAGDFRAGLVTAGLLGAMGIENTLQTVYVEDLTSTIAGDGEASGTTAGTRPAPVLPADAAFVTSFEIARRYRGGHPRSYWPLGVAADLTGPDKFTAAAVLDFTGIVDTALNSFVGRTVAGCTVGAHCNVSYFHGFAVIINPTTGRARNVTSPRAVPIIDDITAVIGRPYVGSMRRRRTKTS